MLSFAFFIMPSFSPWFSSQHQMDQPAAPGTVCFVSISGFPCSKTENVDKNSS